MKSVGAYEFVGVIILLEKGLAYNSFLLKKLPGQQSYKLANAHPTMSDGLNAYRSENASELS